MENFKKSGQSQWQELGKIGLIPANESEFKEQSF